MPHRDHEMLRVAADLAILTVRDGRLQLLAVTRRNPPFAGQSALPGGFVRSREDVERAALRELREETGIDGGTQRLHLEQLGVYSAPDRDPRGRVISVAMLALSPGLPAGVGGSDASDAFWVSVEEVRGTLAFDHDQILDDAVERARTQLEYTTLATAFCPSEFTIGDLQRIYEVVWGEALDPRNFSRKVARTAGFVRATGRMRTPETGRPATLYERGSARLLIPPLMRSARRTELGWTGADGAYRRMEA